jgi:hypothetical protein
VALVVFGAFVLQLAVAASVSAVPTATITHGPTLQNSQVSVSVQVDGLTDPNFGVQWELRLLLPGLSNWVNVTLGDWQVVGQAAYQAYKHEPGVYVSAYAYLTDSVYRLLLNIVYDVAPGTQISGPYEVTFAPRTDQQNRVTGFELQVFRPPREEGAVAPPLVVVLPVDGGTVKVDSTKDEAVLTVDASKVAQWLADPSITEVRLSVPSTVGVSTVAGEIPASVLARSSEYGKPLVLSLAGLAEIRLPPGSFTADAVRAADPNGALRLTVRKLAAGEASPLLAKAESSVWSRQVPVSAVLDIRVEVTAGGSVLGTVAPTKPVVLSLPYDPAAMASSGARPETVCVYRWDEAAGAWLVCASRIDAAKGQVWTVRPGLSKYAAFAWRKTFQDIAGHWAQADIEIMAGRHVARGFSAQSFVPDGKVTRAQFAAFVQRALGLAEENPAQPTFADVAPGSWYYGAVEAAAKAGLVLGYQGRFRPDDLVTREEMSAIIVRAMKLEGKSMEPAEDEVAGLLAKFRDRDAVSDWARSTAAMAVKAGIVRGRAEDLYEPKGDGTRAEAVTMIRRLLGYLGWF